MIGFALLAALVVAALVPPARPVLLVALGFAVLVAPHRSRWLWATAAGLPVALVLTWGAVVGAQSRTDLLDCGDPLAPAVVTRVGEALVVGAVVVFLARRLGVTVRSLGLPRPSALELRIGVLAVLILPVAGLLIGGVLAEPFFGPIRLHLSDPMAVLPALGLAVANGTMEELVYRGALMSWLARVSGWRVALVGQAVVFGSAHAGSDYVGPALPVLVAVAAAGLVAGLIVRRTGSLWLPIIVHVALDVPLYYAAVCRLPPVGVV